MTRRVLRSLVTMSAAVLLAAPAAADQPETQVWGNITVDWITRRRVTDDGATYLLTDAEFFWTRENLKERYASKQRVRGGIGYRRSFAWRFEALYIWDRSRQAAIDGFTTADQAVDFRLHRVW